MSEKSVRRSSLLIFLSIAQCFKWPPRETAPYHEVSTAMLHCFFDLLPLYSFSRMPPVILLTIGMGITELRFIWPVIASPYFDLSQAAQSLLQKYQLDCLKVIQTQVKPEANIFAHDPCLFQIILFFFSICWCFFSCSCNWHMKCGCQNRSLFLFL